MSRPDQVMIQKAAGFNLLTLSEFQSLPLVERCDLLAAGKIQFLSEGKIIPTMQALESLKTA